MKTQGKPYWHIHHTVLWEFATEPIENRIQYIQTHKPAREVETRLRLLRPVGGKLPREVSKAWAEYDKARAEWDKDWAKYYKAHAKYYKDCAEYYKARAEYSKARAELDKALAKYREALEDHKNEIEALHSKECPNCPWNGNTIFP